MNRLTAFLGIWCSVGVFVNTALAQEPAGAARDTATPQAPATGTATPPPTGATSPTTGTATVETTPATTEPPATAATETTGIQTTLPPPTRYDRRDRRDRTEHYFQLALDADAIIPIDEDEVTTGAGGALRLGYEGDHEKFSIIPELAGSVHSFTGDVHPLLFRGVGGVRIVFGEGVRPGIFGHAGVAHVRYYGEGLEDEDGDTLTSTAFTWDAGVTVELAVVDVFHLGVHGAYGMVLEADDAPENLDFVTAGLHAALRF